jgi:hypothetical protein
LEEFSFQLGRVFTSAWKGFHFSLEEFSLQRERVFTSAWKSFHSAKMGLDDPNM